MSVSPFRAVLNFPYPYAEKWWFLGADKQFLHRFHTVGGKKNFCLFDKREYIDLKAQPAGQHKHSPPWTKHNEVSVLKSWVSLLYHTSRSWVGRQILRQY